LPVTKLLLRIGTVKVFRYDPVGEDQPAAGGRVIQTGRGRAVGGGIKHDSGSTLGLEQTTATTKVPLVLKTLAAGLAKLKPA